MNSTIKKNSVGLLIVCLYAIACNNVEPGTTTTTEITPNTRQQGDYFFISTAAYYQGSIDAVESPGKTFSLLLTPDGKAKMTTGFQDEGQMMVDTGAWKTTPDGNVSLTLHRLGLRDSTLIELKPDGDKLLYSKGNKPDMNQLAMTVMPTPPAE